MPRVPKPRKRKKRLSGADLNAVFKRHIPGMGDHYVIRKRGRTVSIIDHKAYGGKVSYKQGDNFRFSIQGNKAEGYLAPPARSMREAKAFALFYLKD